MTKNLKGLMDTMTTEIMDSIPVNQNGDINLHLMHLPREKIKKSLLDAFSLGQQSTLQEVEEVVDSHRAEIVGKIDSGFSHDSPEILKKKLEVVLDILYAVSHLKDKR